MERLPGDKRYCSHFRKIFPYNEDAWFLDIVDIAVIDFLMSHLDAKHTYVSDVARNNTPLFNVMFDFGHA